jgi:hypothetical protein
MAVSENTQQLLGISALPGYLPHWVARKWTWSDWPSSVSLESQIAFFGKKAAIASSTRDSEKHDELVFHLSLIAQVRPQDHPAIMAHLRKQSSEKPPRPAVRLCDFSLLTADEIAAVAGLDAVRVKAALNRYAATSQLCRTTVAGERSQAAQYYYFVDSIRHVIDSFLD